MGRYDGDSQGGPELDFLVDEHLEDEDQARIPWCLDRAPQMLRGSETPELISDAYFEHGWGLLVLTDERLFFTSETLEGDCLWEVPVDAELGAEVAETPSATLPGRTDVVVSSGDLRFLLGGVGDRVWAQRVASEISGWSAETIEPLEDVAGLNIVRCPLCGTALAGRDPVCPNCRIGIATDGTSGRESTGEVGKDADQDVVIRPFETPNPYLQRIFTLEAFGSAPAAAVSLLREVSPDDEEKLITALRTRHGSLRSGYLLATTSYLRWIQTVPGRRADYWDYSYPIEVVGGPMQSTVVRVVSGDQFQMRWSKAKALSEIYQYLQQAIAWEVQHQETEAPTPRVGTTGEFARGDGLGSELERIAGLYQQGLLTNEEFSQAKERLLGGL
jgi:hypothetical protein